MQLLVDDDLTGFLLPLIATSNSLVTRKASQHHEQ